MSKIRILMLIPLWKRPEIVRLFIYRMEAVTPDYAEILPLFILSPEDPNLQTLEKFTEGYQKFYYPNEYLSDKLNAGLTYAVKELKWDYLMNMGSDNIYTQLLWELYRDYFEVGEKYFSINNFYVYDIINERAWFMQRYVDGEELGGIGAGRVIHRSLIEDDPCIYRPRTCQGMDGFSAFNLFKKGHVQAIVETNDLPVMLDIKTNTNVNHAMELYPQRERDIPVNWIKQQFELIDSRILDDGTFDLLRFDGFHDRVLKESRNIRKEDAFNMVNVKYEITFGEPRYANYDSYKSQVSKRSKR